MKINIAHLIDTIRRLDTTKSNNKNNTKNRPRNVFDQYKRDLGVFMSQNEGIYKCFKQGYGPLKLDCYIFSSFSTEIGAEVKFIHYP